MRSLEVSSFGPIKRGEVRFGDLTILVGPQASGKSLFVQLFKVIEDSGAVSRNLKQYGFTWPKDKDPVGSFLSIYFGGGMESVWKRDTSINVDGKPYDFRSRVVKPRRGPTNHKETAFLIPAQRVLALQDGWPKPFLGFPQGSPYCSRDFSESMRLLMEHGLGSGKAIFPQPGRLKSQLRRLIDEDIYVGAELLQHTDGQRKQIVLWPDGSDAPLPYSAWSAGQREFTPLLMGMYWLMPSTKIKRKGDVRTVIIEEPEMGLHPQAIVSFCLLMLELLWRGYRVILSTHSPVVLDVVWALKELAQLEEGAALQSLKKIFRVGILGQPIKEVFASALKKDYRVYFFDRTDDEVEIRDISSLDPGDDDDKISGWGGLSGFSGRIADLVGDALNAGSMA
ncbi:MAG: ATP-binding protein [Planctomycetes bacterium]|nr:ATP-binding protein [Planctomycetota bacterium]